MTGAAGIVLGILLFLDGRYQYLAPPLLIIWAIMLISARSRVQELEKTLRDLRVELRNNQVKIESLGKQAKQQQVAVKIIPTKSREKKVVRPVAKPKKVTSPAVEKLKVPPIAKPKAPVFTANPINSANYEAGRAWTPFENVKLKNLYNQFASVGEMSVQLEREPKEVVIKLAEVIYSQFGELEDISLAPNNQGRWSRDRRIELGSRFRAGESIESLAKRFGRTRLAIVWQLINIRVEEN